MLLFLALYMVVSVAYGLGSYTTPESVDEGSGANDLDHKDELQPIGDWSEYGDHEVWLTARKMLEDLSQGGFKKMTHSESEESLETSQKLTSEGGQLNSTELGTKYPNPHRSLVKESEPRLILAKPQADLLLKGRVYFGHRSSTYCYDENRIVFRFTEGRYYQVTTIVPNPPELDTPFTINGISYCFDKNGVLKHKKGGNWLLETIHGGPNMDCPIQSHQRW
ncbi:hypothetical protein B0J17DRAFT_710064 [Rhizoctonia solani]|nr:hypothetical protein B0J17DRAFT_710064 [Rhizoctonia solani]